MVPSFFDKLRQGLARTRANFVAGMRGALRRGRVDEELFDDFERALLGADVGVEATERLLDRLRQRVRDEAIADAGAAEAALKEELVALLETAAGNRRSGAREARAKPHVIMVIGVNGVGKTTTIGKLAKREMSEGRSVLIGACDTFRAAAGEQLEAWAERAGVPIVRQRDGADPAAVAFDVVAAGEARQADVVILDTAGRLHTKSNLMEELKKVQRVVARRLPGAPHEVLLCLDATTGQNAIRQAQEFDAAIGVSGLILAKLDGTARGGVVVAVASELGLPVDMVGVGEGIDDLVPFDARDFADAMFAKAEAASPEPGR
jgi:fused signal recognition particle receptor